MKSDVTDVAVREVPDLVGAGDVVRVRGPRRARGLRRGVELRVERVRRLVAGVRVRLVQDLLEPVRGARRHRPCLVGRQVVEHHLESLRRVEHVQLQPVTAVHLQVGRRIRIPGVRVRDERDRIGRRVRLAVVREVRPVDRLQPDRGSRRRRCCSPPVVLVDVEAVDRQRDAPLQARAVEARELRHPAQVDRTAAPCRRCPAPCRCSAGCFGLVSSKMLRSLSGLHVLCWYSGDDCVSHMIIPNQ